MTDPVDQEVEAIRIVLGALTPLSEKARASVLEYVTKRLNADALGRPDDDRHAPTGSETLEKQPSPEGDSVFHITRLKEEKKPRSANEMAALVGYYLSSLAPQAARKSTINRKDIETYFKIAKFPLPNQIQVTLANAKTAGYFDAVGDGEYKLNAVGHNLVVHSMPRGSSTGAGAKRKLPKRAPRTKRRQA
jgi:hypothetical protein